METSALQRKARRVTRFMLVQFCALAGWIAIQLFFSLSPFGRTFSFSTVILVEAIWWMALLLVMLRLFLREYQRFVQAALDLEEANLKLRRRTRDILEQLRLEHFPEDREPLRLATYSEDHGEVSHQESPSEK